MGVTLTVDGKQVDKLPDEFMEQARASITPEHKEKIAAFLNDMRGKPEFQKFMAGDDGAGAGSSAEVEESDLSPAAQRLAKLRAQRGPIIEDCQIDGATWFLKRLPWPDLTKITVAVARSDEGALTEATDVRRATAIALLTYGVACGPDDTSPFFDKKTATEYVDEPAAAGLIEKLCNKLVEINPELIPGEREGVSGKDAPANPTQGTSTGTASTVPSVMSPTGAIS